MARKTNMFGPVERTRTNMMLGKAKVRRVVSEARREPEDRTALKVMLVVLGIGVIGVAAILAM